MHDKPIKVFPCLKTGERRFQMESVNCDICILHDAKEESVTIVSAKAHKVIVRKYKKSDDELTSSHD